MVEDYPTVIVRAFGDEPVVLTSHGKGSSRYVIVGKAGIPTERCIGFPPDDVFEYDDWQFTRLKRAYDEGNKALLAELYSETKLLFPPVPHQGKKDEPCATCGEIVPRKTQWKCAGRTYHEQCFPQELLPPPAQRT